MAEPSLEMESDEGSDSTINNRDSKIPVWNCFKKDVELGTTQFEYSVYLYSVNARL